MAGFVPAIHDLKEDVDARHRPGLTVFDVAEI